MPDDGARYDRAAARRDGDFCLPGGKGMIVCRGARRLGTAVTAHGFVGGFVGEVIRRGGEEMGVADRHVQILGETRVTPVVIERSTGRSTVLNERGPMVTGDEQDLLGAGLAAAIRLGDVVVSTGSLPPGCAPDLHATVARLALRHGATALVDAHGDALARVIDERSPCRSPKSMRPIDCAPEETVTIRAGAEPISRSSSRLVSRNGARWFRAKVCSSPSAVTCR